MNVVTLNYGYWRVTDYGRAMQGAMRYSLYNRHSDVVYEISEDDYRFIRDNLEPIDACMRVAETASEI